VHELRDDERLRVTQPVVTLALARIGAGVATVIAVVLLFDTFGPGHYRPFKIGVAIGLAIAVSAIVGSRLSRTPVSVPFIVLRAVISGLVASLVLSYFQQ
jgi:hypothetical protein